MRRKRQERQKWEDSTWRLLPALPASMCAAAGFPLVTSCRSMANLTDVQKARLFQLLINHDTRGWSTAEEKAEIKELLALTSYGMELPILDVDTIKVGKNIPPSEVEAAKEKIGRAATELAVKLSAAWQELLGVNVRWTVTNDRGGLHGRSMMLPADLHHPDLLMMLTDELVEQCKKRGIPYKLVGGRGEWKNEDLAVVDLSTFQKSGAGRGGMWRSPGSKKDAHMGPGSLPQTPASQMLGVMPWLAAITPEALGSDWAPIPEETKARLLQLCESRRDRLDEKAIKSGRAVRGEDGKVRRVRAAAVTTVEALGKTEFGEVALVVDGLMPKGENEGMKRHEVRLALAGWFYRQGLPEEAAARTLEACGGNLDDSRKVVRTTYDRANGGESVAGLRRLGELLGQDAVGALDRAFGADASKRLKPGMDPADQEPGTDPADQEPGMDPADQEPADQELGEGLDDGPDDDGGSHDGPGPDTAGPPDPAPPDPEPEPDPAPTPDPSRPRVAVSSIRSTKKSSGGGKPRSVAPGDPTGPGVHARSLIDLHLPAAAKTAKSARFNKGALTETQAELSRIRLGIPDVGGKAWFLQKAVADTLAFAGLGVNLVTRLALAGTTKFYSLHQIYSDMAQTIARWSPGEEIPKVHSTSSIKGSIGHWDYLKLSSAIANDLRKAGAPFDVQNRATIDSPWSGEERDRMQYAVDRITKGDKSKIKGPLKYVKDAQRCGYVLNRRSCTSHGDVSKIPVSCDREVACKFCRSYQFQNIVDWVTHKWIQDKFVTFEVPAQTDGVIKAIREKREVDKDGKFVNPDDKKPGSCREDDEAKSTLLPKAYPDEKRFWFRLDPKAKDGVRMRVLTRRRNRSKVVERRYVTDLLDRIKIGFTKSEAFKTFKKVYNDQLGIRAWPTVNGIRVVMPASYMAVDDKGEIIDPMAEAESTLFHLKANDLWQDCNPREVGKEEALALILEARRGIAEAFDRMIYDLGQSEDKAVAAEEGLSSFSFLRANALRPIKNKAAERDMPWFTREQMRAFKKELRRERLGLKEEDEVAPDECPLPVQDGKGGECPCRRKLSVDLMSGPNEVLVRNTHGKYYPRAEAWEIAEGLGITFTSVQAPVGRFAPSLAPEPMRC